MILLQYFSIWSYLAQLVVSPKPEGTSSPGQDRSIQFKKRRTTILITTHYIEEARQATVVGLMRDGYLLAEENPIRLMTAYNLTTLEEVFLKLYANQHDQVSLTFKIDYSKHCPGALAQSFLETQMKMANKTCAHTSKLTM